MLNRLMNYATFILMFALAHPAVAQVDWKKVKRFIQEDVQIKEETKEYLILYHPELGKTVQVSISETSSTDIRGERSYRRGGNPYIKWEATIRLLNNQALPREMWSRFLKSEFLSLLRPSRLG